MGLLNQRELDQKLDHIVARVRSVFVPSTIYLYGSYAYGTPRSDSDIDLLVIVEDSPLRAHARDALAYQAVGAIGVSKDIQVYTLSEFQDRAALPVSFERTVKEKGRVIYAAANP